jgi:hypothetical protein
MSRCLNSKLDWQKEEAAVSQTAIFRFLRHLALTFKKNLHAAEQDRPDAARKAWFRTQPSSIQ